MNRLYVLDASAILDFFTDGPGAARLTHLLQDASRGDAVLLVSVVNWGEVFYHSWQRHGEESARRRLNDLARLPVRAMPVDVPQVMKAGEIKALHQIPYVDCLAAALTSLNKGTLVTSDRDFEKLGRQFPIMWLGRR